MSLDRYRLRAQLGAGLDGIAYRAVAEDGVTEVEVRDLSRARRCAGRWGRWLPGSAWRHELDHPAAIRVLELGLEHDPPFVVMEWVGTTTLDRRCSATGRKSRDEAMELVRAVAGALHAAHRLGLPHGRLGPGRCSWPARPNRSSTSPAPWSVSRATPTSPGLVDGASVAFALATHPATGRRPLQPGRPARLAAGRPPRSDRAPGCTG